MTAPFSLFSSNFNPSMSDLNTLINQLNAMFTNVSVAGDEAVSGNLAVTGTTALTGNATAAGTLTVTGLTTLNGGLAGGASADIAINTNKFTVAAASGNTLVAGTMAVTGATTLTGALAVTAATQLTGLLGLSAAATVSAAGTTRADSTALTAQFNKLTTVAASTGVNLAALTAGQFQVIDNGGANLCQVYAPGSITIDGTAGSTGVALTNAKRALYLCIATDTVISMQLGVVSA